MPINSKYISYLLRHDNRIENIVDDHGFISLDDLNRIIWNDKHELINEQQMIEITEDPTTKKRFEYEYRPIVEATKNLKLYIRALNGHSFRFTYIYHVTNSHLVENILNEGLKPMARQFVHLYEQKNSVKYDGKRNTLLEIGPINEEIELFRSKNGYLMCPHIIPPK
ncbi:putative RNA 2'-phosphotransferase [Dermatophagoides farinae]|uniref:putative RNA 2'-phosphotransferase n=1 Tax=Dermatophagoides farinae TaxID=6954 RepID=UPI003F5DF99A